MCASCYQKAHTTMLHGVCTALLTHYEDKTFEAQKYHICCAFRIGRFGMALCALYGWSWGWLGWKGCNFLVFLGLLKERISLALHSRTFARTYRAERALGTWPGKHSQQCPMSRIPHSTSNMPHLAENQRRSPPPPCPGPPPPTDQSDHRGKKRNLPPGKSDQSIFGTLLGPRPPPPSLLMLACPHPMSQDAARAMRHGTFTAWLLGHVQRKGAVLLFGFVLGLRGSPICWEQSLLPERQPQSCVLPCSNARPFRVLLPLLCKSTLFGWGRLRCLRHTNGCPTFDGHVPLSGGNSATCLGGIAVRQKIKSRVDTRRRREIVEGNSKLKPHCFITNHH